MKLESDNKITSVVYGDVEQSKFGIAITGKMYDILSSKLYSNKIAAPVREIICNAVDAHVAAGTTDKKFVVHLPSQEEPYFGVRDYGTGLTHQEILDIYTVYGMSTKADTNTAIGCLGLGSKSPFAYTDRFTIYSYKGGELSVYQCMREDEAPVILKLDTCKTTEPNGLDVRFDVKVDDIGGFATALRNLLLLKDKMEIVGGEIMSWGGLTIPERLGKGYEILTNNNYSWLCRAVGNSLSVEMGGVIYAVAWYNNEEISEEIRQTTDTSSSARVLIHANIGDVDIAISRELVELTEKTVSYIVKALRDFRTKAKVFVVNQIKKENGLIRKLLRYRLFKEDYGTIIGNNLPYERYFREFCLYLYERSTMTVVKPYAKKREKFSSLARFWLSSCSSKLKSFLEGKADLYFLDLSKKRIAPAEVRNFASATGTTVYCVHDPREAAILRKMGISLHSLAELDDYKPVRIRYPRVKKDKTFNFRLLVAVNNWHREDLEDFYRKGTPILYITNDEESSCIEVKKLPYADACGLEDERKLSLSVFAGCVNDLAVVRIKDDKDIDKVKRDSHFVSLSEVVKEQLKDKRSFKKHVEHYLFSEFYNYFGYWSSRYWGEQTAKFFIKELRRKNKNDALLPLVSDALLLKDFGKHGDLEESSLSCVAKTLVERYYRYAAYSYKTSVESFLRDLVENAFPLLNDYLTVETSGTGRRELMYRSADVDDYLNERIKRYYQKKHQK